MKAPCSCLLAICIVVFFFGCSHSQPPIPDYPGLALDDIEILGELPEGVLESSGQVEMPYGTLLGHNDSDSGPELFEYSTEGKLIRKIRVLNAKNNDWEDIAISGDSIYIADTGNNAGWRRWLTVYVIPIPSAGSSDIDVVASSIKFKYPGRGVHIPWTRHNYDCEALIVKGERLWIFSKNHANYRTTVYSLPKYEGKYTARKEISINIHGLVTGADTYGDKLVLLGYAKDKSGFDPFICLYENWNTMASGDDGQRLNIPLRLQTEAISFIGNGDIIFTNEEEDGDQGMIMKVGRELTGNLMGRD